MNPRHSYAYLDGVRGWAALMVAYGHFIFATHAAALGAGEWRAHFAAEAWLGHTGFIVLYNPELAVDIFFVLSGFVLATSVNARPAPFIELVVRRWARLGLPILGSTALIWPLVHWHLFWPDEAGALSKSDWLLLCYNWTCRLVYPDLTLLRLFWQSLVQVFVTGNWYNPALWTMRWEFWASIALYAGYCLLPARFIARGGGLLAALIAIGFVWNVPLLGSFADGVALCELVRLIRRQPDQRRARLARAAPAAAIVLLAAGVFLGGMPYDVAPNGVYARIFMALWPWLGVVQGALFRLAALALVAAVLLSPLLQRLLLTRLSQWLGRISFMLYLVHVPILCSLGVWLLLGLEPLLGYNATTVVIFPVFLAAALAMAELTTRCIDAPAIRFSRQLGAAVPPALRRFGGALRPVAAAR